MGNKSETNLDVLAARPGNPPALSAAEIFTQAAPSMVRVTNYLGPLPISEGSGFFVNTQSPESCEIVTGNVVAGGQSTFVTTRDGKTHSARAEVLDFAHDISIYKLDDVKNAKDICRPLALESGAAKDKDHLVNIGAAGDENLFGLRGATATIPKFREGQLVGRTTKAEIYGGYYVLGYPKIENAFSPMLKSTSMGVEGYAGGPWLNPKGKVIGLTFNANSAEPSTFIQQDLDLAHSRKP